jgi:hypothetical protein
MSETKQEILQELSSLIASIVLENPEDVKDFLDTIHATLAEKFDDHSVKLEVIGALWSEERKEHVAEFKQFMIIRDGLPPLRFKGVCIGEASTKTSYNDTRGTDISIYKTKGGKFVVEVEVWSCWQGETGSTSAYSFDDFKALIEGLEQNEGCLSAVAQEAIEDAIKERPELRECYIEDVT